MFKFTVLCLLNEGRGHREFEFSSRHEAVDFRLKNLKKYYQIFIYTEEL